MATGIVGYSGREIKSVAPNSPREMVNAKVAAARVAPEVMNSQDWSGLDLVIDHLVDLVRHITLPGP